MASAVIEGNITLINHEEIQSTIKFSKSKFHEFFPCIDISPFFIKPVHKTEIKNINLSLNHLHAVSQ